MSLSLSLDIVSNSLERLFQSFVFFLKKVFVGKEVNYFFYGKIKWVWQSISIIELQIKIVSSGLGVPSIYTKICMTYKI